MASEAIKQALAEEIESSLGVVGPLHVEPDEATELFGFFEDPDHVRRAKVLPDVETHLGEFHRYVDFGARGEQCFEHSEVLVARGECFALLRNAFAQEVEGGSDPATREVTRGRYRGVHCFPGYEAGREPSGDAVSPDESKDRRSLGEPKQALTHDQQMGSYILAVTYFTMPELTPTKLFGPLSINKATATQQAGLDGRRYGRHLKLPV